MVIGRTVICDFCYESCLPNDFTTVHLEKSGQPFEFIFHNTIERPCLLLKLEELQQQFAAPQQ